MTIRREPTALSVSRRSLFTLTATAILFPTMSISAGKTVTRTHAAKTQFMDRGAAEWMDFAPHADINKFPCPMRDKW